MGDVEKGDTKGVATGEVVAKEKKGWQKWGKRFLHFLAYGGWIAIAVIVLAIVIAASTCGRGA